MADHTVNPVVLPSRKIPLEFLRGLFRYCPDTGTIFHLGTSKEAGYQCHNGYRALKVSFNGRRYQIASHVVAWFLHHGVWPKDDVDHRDTVRHNNRMGNLREATRSQNLVNRNKSGGLPKGVWLDKTAKARPFKAQLKHQKKNYYLGAYTTAEEAHQAYLKLAVQLHGEFVRA